MASSSLEAYQNSAYNSIPINANSTASPVSSIEQQPTIGIIGMGAMGSMYAKALCLAGWKSPVGRIHVCDGPERFEQLEKDYMDKPFVPVMKNGHAVSRSSDFMVCSVEAEVIDKVVAEYGPSTKMHAIVAGQISVKAPEKAAFENLFPRMFTSSRVIHCMDPQ